MLTRKVLERILGQQVSKATGAAIQHGIDNEANARTAYEFARNVSVKEVGLFKHNRIARTHASPDGVLADANIGVELKAPTPATHFETLMSGEIPEKYRVQCLWQIAVCGFEAVDYVSYDPRFNPSAQLFIKRVDRDAAAIADLEARVEQFLAEVDAKEAEFRNRFAEAA